MNMSVKSDVSGQEATVLTYDRLTGMLTLDRNRSGKGPGGICQVPVELLDGGSARHPLVSPLIRSSMRLRNPVSF
ncbi:hypothetical protein KZ483_15025 [Paenibacillus sp. sptzw28]|uniref:hypothetical protein n=1 Tax=Paenibacillus sp. sptzw28 TaxID=715179 RepID=UPI001C6F1CC0|nr:hypothetical protein [Paenibacillus sp. sptzw28]QYR24402.1 hypothetical protein KZ483_15025 [Paenibacillus sp. sptzw28]